MTRILKNENWLRDVDGPGGLVTLTDAGTVFPQSLLTEHGRTLVRPRSPSSFEVLCDSRPEKITIQPSAEAFAQAFDRTSDGLLKSVDWSNLFVAGGIVLGTLLAVHGSETGPDGQWESSDIDIYIYGLSSLDATNKAKHVHDIFKSNLRARGIKSSLAVKNSKTITFYARYPLRRIQIILKLVKSPKDVLLNFDLDICAMGWDGNEVLMLPRAARALESMLLAIVDIQTYSDPIAK